MRRKLKEKKTTSEMKNKLYGMQKRIFTNEERQENKQ